jgi:hypothetical protein
MFDRKFAENPSICGESESSNLQLIAVASKYSGGRTQYLSFVADEPINGLSGACLLSGAQWCLSIQRWSLVLVCYFKTSLAVVSGACLLFQI